MKDNKASAITENKKKMWILFPIYYLTASVLLSYYIFLIIKQATFIRKSCTFTVLGKGEFVGLHPSVRERTPQRESGSHLLSLKRQFICCLAMTNIHLFLTLSLPLCLSFPLPLSLSLSFSLPLPLSLFPLFSVKLLTSNPITLQFVFTMPQFSLENI